MKRFFLVLVCSWAAPFLGADIPEIPFAQIYFVKAAGGWDLYVKKLDGIESIILTESQRDPEYRVTAYSLRSLSKNAVNASEKRILDSRPINPPDATGYLIDSTPEKVGTFGEFYRFFLTDEVVYGYPWARTGRLKIEAGAKINLRKFSKKYGDYRGRFKDQWIVLTPRAFPEEKVEEPRAETTIVLLHSSDVDAEIAPAPAAKAGPEIVAQAEKLAGLAGGQRSVSASFTWIVVDKLDRFPFARLKDTPPAAGAALKAGEERVLRKELFANDENNASVNAGFATYHEDAQGRLVRINEYGRENRLAAVHVLEYADGPAPVRATVYGPDGRPRAAE